MYRTWYEITSYVGITPEFLSYTLPAALRTPPRTIQHKRAISHIHYIFPHASIALPRSKIQSLHFGLRCNSSERYPVVQLMCWCMPEKRGQGVDYHKVTGAVASSVETSCLIISRLLLRFQLLILISLLYCLPGIMNWGGHWKHVLRQGRYEFRRDVCPEFCHVSSFVCKKEM